MTRHYQGRQLTDKQAKQRRDITRRMLDRVSKVGDTSWPEAGYVIDSDDARNTPDDAFCYEHAWMVARGESILTGFEMFIVNVSMEETDHEEWCAFHGCGKPVNTGSPTDQWIDSALGLTEEDPYAVIVTPYELSRSFWNMSIDDKRWTVWMRQAKRVLIAARVGGTP